MKKVIIAICIMSMSMLTACSDIRYLSSIGKETYIDIPKKYIYIKAYHWEDNKLIIEFAEDGNE